MLLWITVIVPNEVSSTASSLESVVTIIVTNNFLIVLSVGLKCFRTVYLLGLSSNYYFLSVVVSYDWCFIACVMFAL